MPFLTLNSHLGAFQALFDSKTAIQKHRLPFILTSKKPVYSILLATDGKKPASSWQWRFTARVPTIRTIPAAKL